ncbi:MAG: hypothetical protein Q8P45_00255 [Candidatus Harrisonbacteria bacterium]|nr:hypothetical protein [Candidatus Harrisonbacteria bacterium]
MVALNNSFQRKVLVSLLRRALDQREEFSEQDSLLLKRLKEARGESQLSNRELLSQLNQRRGVIPAQGQTALQLV